MAGYVERGEMPGLVALVSRRGEVHVDAIGRKSLGGADAIRRAGAEESQDPAPSMGPDPRIGVVRPGPAWG